MELKNILTFLRTAELKSFSNAAKELGYSQSTVTVHIKQLEEELGFKLFDRIGKKISLTPFGVEFIHYANEFMRLSSEVQSLGRTGTSHVGTLRLGIIESLFVWKSTHILPALNSKFPNVNIEIKSNTGATLYKMLRQNELDIIYVLDDILYQKDCVRAFKCPENCHFVTWPENKLLRKKTIPLSSIIKEPLILAERDAVYRRALDSEAAKHSVEIIPTIEIDNIEVILRLLKKRMGISFLPDYSTKESLEKGELAVLDVDFEGVNIWSQVLYHKNKFVTPYMEMFIELIKNTPI